jgi:large subunit ribosomal protein L4e
MKVTLYSVKGKAKKKVELPGVFATEYRPDLIKRAVVALQSHRLQAYGSDPLAGKRTSAESWGPGHGVARVPRMKGSRYPAAGRAAFVPMAVGGRRAHPPKVEKRIYEKINRKERLKAIASAIAATAKRELVLARGHLLPEKLELPLVVENAFEKLSRVNEVKEFLAALDLLNDVERASKRKVRAGVGKRRGRRYKNRKSLLIVVGEDKGISRGARNLPGVEVVLARDLSAEHLAPGTHAGRLTLYTENALKVLEERF